MTSLSPPVTPPPAPSRPRAIDRLDLTANQLTTIAARVTDPMVWWLHAFEELTRHVSWQLRLAEACPQLHGLDTPSYLRTRALVQAAGLGLPLRPDRLAPMSARCVLLASETSGLLASAMSNEDLEGPAAAVRLQLAHLDRLATLAEQPTAEVIA